MEKKKEINAPVPESELEIITRNMLELCAKDGFIPYSFVLPPNYVEKEARILYDELFKWRDSQVELPRQRPSAYTLVELFKDLKYGRDCEDQIFLQKCIDVLEK